jgi:hypothetical protein
MTGDNPNFDHSELERILDTWGADRNRWPTSVRARADSLIGATTDARAMLREAAAFDALLDRAPVPSTSRRAAVSERILSTAVAAQGPSQREGVVLPWPGARRPQIARPAPAAYARFRSAWAAPALLAASLAAGIFMGALDMVPSPVNQLVQAVELDGDLEQSVAAADNDGLASVLDEDLL